MSWPADPDPLGVSVGQSSGPTLEIPTTSPELVEALRHDRQVLVREAILWQRWIRYLGFLALVAMALMLAKHNKLALLKKW